MKKISDIVLVILLFAGQFAYAQTAPAAINDTAKPGFKLLKNNSTVDFGTIMVNSVVTRELEFINPGSKELVIMNMYSPGNGIGPDAKMSIKWPRKPVRPGKKGKITVTIRPRSDVGSFSSDIYVTWNASIENYPLLHIIGTVINVPDKYTDTHHAYESGKIIVHKQRLWKYKKVNRREL